MSSMPFADPQRPDDHKQSDDDLIVSGRYKLTVPGTDKPGLYTRATTFAKIITDTFMIQLWNQRMVAKGLAIRPDLLAMVQATNDREKLNQICEQAKIAAGSKVGANIGTVIHQFAEDTDMERDVTMGSMFVPIIDMYQARLKEGGYEIVKEYVERVVYCPRFKVAGKLDRIVRVQEDGTLVIGDLKSAANIGYAWLEIAVQLTLYAHAEYVYDRNTDTFSPMPDVNKEYALVFHVPVPANLGDDPVCDVYKIDLNIGLEACELSEEVRRMRKLKTIATRLNPQYARALTAPSIDWKARIDQATCRQDLSDIWQEATIRGEWTKVLEDYGHSRARELRG